MKRIAVRKLTWRQAVVLAGLGALIPAGIAVATPASGLTIAQVGKALYGDFHMKAEREGWEAELQTKGLSDVIVNKVSLVPGATSGWHSHPGLSFVSVTAGEVTLYAANDPNCTPFVVTAGFGFVEPGDHVHLVRNEGTVDATFIYTAIRPAGSAGSIDQPRPPQCSVE
jgi:quercetin dioxygenase-like cupin family protein